MVRKIQCPSGNEKHFLLSFHLETQTYHVGPQSTYRLFLFQNVSGFHGHKAQTVCWLLDTRRHTMLSQRYVSRYV